MRFALALLLALLATPLHARPHILVDLTADRVIDAQEAFRPWHPASLTKMMTAYTVLDMMRLGEIGPDTNVKMTWWASQQSPSKMGFKPGTLVPIRDALAMIAVKSANDVSQAIAESLSDRRPENFYARMNENARRIGMIATVFVNPHGLHDPEQITSARDMGLLVRALSRDFPDWMWLWRTPAIRVAPAEGVRERSYRSFNALLERFPGANGMKTGYVCASGWNFAGSATRDGRTVVAIVLGRNTATDRVIDAAKMLERSFEAGPEAASGGTKLDELVPSAQVPAEPPNLRPVVCAAKRPASKPGELEYLPQGVQGPPGPPRQWLLPKSAATALAPVPVRTAGRVAHAPDLSGVTDLPTPRPPDPAIDDLDLVPSPYPTVPAQRPPHPSEAAAAGR